MDKQILIPINLFSLNQQIVIIDENGNMNNFAQVELTSLPEVVVEASRVYDISKIKIIGNANYGEALSNEINEFANSNYSNSNLNIIVLEG